MSPSCPQTADDHTVLFNLPVTKAWLRQLILGLTLTCHSSLRGVAELFGDVFDSSISVGTIHNVLQAAAAQARSCNQQQDLSHVRIGAHDEIFQSSRPVLVGVDAYSTYCYLLSLEEHRDADTWGVRLLDLQAQGFQPEATVADAGIVWRRVSYPANRPVRWPRSLKTGRTRPSAPPPTWRGRRRGLSGGANAR